MGPMANLRRTIGLSNRAEEDTLTPRERRLMRTRWGFFLAITSTVLVSTNFITAKYALEGFDPVSFSLVWTALAAFFGLVILIAAGEAKGLVPPRPHRRPILLLGLTTGAGMLFGWAGLALLDPSFAAFLWRFSPLMTIGMSYVVLKERLFMWEIAAMLIMVVGGVVSTLGRWDIVGLGVTLTLVSCLMVGVQMIVAKVAVGDMSPYVVAFYRVAIGCVVIAVWAVAFGDIDLDVEAHYWYVLILGALVGPCISHILKFWAYRYVDLTRVSVIVMMQPLVVLPMAYGILGKVPSGRELLGGMIILAGALWLVLIHLKGDK